LLGISFSELFQHSFFQSFSVSVFIGLETFYRDADMLRTITGKATNLFFFRDIVILAHIFVVNKEIGTSCSSKVWGTRYARQGQDMRNDSKVRHNRGAFSAGIRKDRDIRSKVGERRLTLISQEDFWGVFRALISRRFVSI
jgi:hypothetical protein